MSAWQQQKRTQKTAISTDERKSMLHNTSFQSYSQIHSSVSLKHLKRILWFNYVEHDQTTAALFGIKSLLKEKKTNLMLIMTNLQASLFFMKRTLSKTFFVVAALMTIRPFFYHTVSHISSGFDKLKFERLFTTSNR